MKPRGVLTLFALSQLLSCGEEDWAREVDMEEESIASLSVEELALNRLIRQLPKYYETIGSPMPEDSMEALLAVKRIAPLGDRQLLASMVVRVQKGVAKTILHGKEGAVPFSPFHLAMGFTRTLYKGHQNPNKAVGYHQLTRAKQLGHLVFSGLETVGQSKRESQFNQLYRSLAEYYQFESPIRNSKLLAMETLERGTFHSPFLCYPEDPGLNSGRLDKFRLAIAGGFKDLPRIKKSKLIDLIREFIKLYEALDAPDVDEKKYSELVNKRALFLKENAETFDSYI